MHPARPLAARPLAARPLSGRRAAAVFGVLIGAGALLVLGAGGSYAAADGAKVSATNPSGLNSSDAGIDAGLGVDFGYQADTVTSTSLPAGGLAAALILAGAGTVMATRAMCSGRGWR